MRTVDGDPAQGLAFPAVGIGLQRSLGLRGLRLRAFGITGEDLNLDFAMARPLLEIRILSLCAPDGEGRPPPDAFFRGLEVGERTLCLILVAALGRTEPGMEIDLRCPAEGCGEEIEVELGVQDLLGLLPPDRTAGPLAVPAGAEGIALRRPTGEDQLRWLREEFADEDAAVAAMARSLVQPPGDLERLARDGLDWRGLLAEALEEADPLVNFQVRIPCPECGVRSLHALDLGARALERLGQARDRLLRSVHVLASRYHWSEEQITALPPWRRERYLALLDAGAG